MPSFTGVSHVGLSVTDLDRSVAWYTDVLGLQFVMPTDAPGFRRALLAHESGMLVGLTQHDANDATPFAESTTGLDHLAFAVPDRDALVEWEARLTEKGVTNAGINDTFYGSVLVLRDPDNVQLELFVRATQPA